MEKLLAKKVNKNKKHGPNEEPKWVYKD